MPITSSTYRILDMYSANSVLISDAVPSTRLIEEATKPILVAA